MRKGRRDVGGVSVFMLVERGGGGVVKRSEIVSGDGKLVLRGGELWHPRSSSATRLWQPCGLPINLSYTLDYFLFGK